ncbi:MAG: ribonuclease P protein component [Acidimicrobiales bacterium]|nr:ribonuclease P protein component [Acidimicrobiales bacterium]
MRSNGLRVRSGPLSVVHLHETGAGDPPVRVAFAITRKVGTAVVRNRLRRRLRAICADLQRDRPGGLPPGALLISAGPEAVRRTPDELRQDVVRLIDALETRRSVEQR